MIKGDRVTINQIAARMGWLKENTYPVVKSYASLGLLVKRGQTYELNLPEIDRINNISKKLAAFWEGDNILTRGGGLNRKKILKKVDENSLKITGFNRMDNEKIDIDCRFAIGDSAYFFKGANIIKMRITGFSIFIDRVDDEGVKCSVTYKGVTNDGVVGELSSDYIMTKEELNNKLKEVR